MTQSGMAICQDILVRGAVMDSETADVLRDVQVYTHIHSGTYSDIDGNFVVKVLSGDTLHFSLLGYKEQQYVVTDSIRYQNIMISMKKTTIVLEDVQVSSMYQANTIIRNPRLESVHVNGVYAAPKTEADDYRLGAMGAVASPATAVYRMVSKQYKQEKRVYNESLAREAEGETFDVAKEKMEEILEIMGQRLDEYYYIDFIHYAGMDLQSFARREVYELVQILPKNLDGYYDYLDEKLKEEERIKSGAKQNPTFH
ncbi:CarboxypepD_reg-like domain-containing protein [Reichenbachiella agariperforans]|uniref:CarboxypepD_reg-like domain-containing protein n=3 Tax=Reichenbachiella TaxID=156993 RepID=A0A1M6THZ4_REIAG|nr:CarboxypepD_reg-like domain-containing protein [Reichenbachiella agariperforans]